MENEFIAGYFVFKYKIRNGKFMVYAEGSQSVYKIKAAIKNGDIRGRVDSGIVTEPTEGVRKFIEENESWIFTEKHELTRK